MLCNDYGPPVLVNGPHLLGNMSHSALCRIRGYVIWNYVVRHYVAFEVMLFGIMSHLALCLSGLCRLLYLFFKHGVICSWSLSCSVADPDLWIRICIIKVGSGSVWRDTNPDLDPGHIR